MPASGPGDNQINADKAFNEILSLIKDRYGVSPDWVMKQPTYREEAAAELENLRQAIRNIFRLDSWASW